MEIAVNNWEGTPAEDLVVTRILTREVDELEEDHVGGEQVNTGRQHEVHLVLVEVNLRALDRVVIDDRRVYLAEVQPDPFGLLALVHLFVLFLVKPDFGLAHVVGEHGKFGVADVGLLAFGAVVDVLVPADFGAAGFLVIFFAEVLLGLEKVSAFVVMIF